MGISTGMKIGMASGFMARREKIEEQEQEQTEDFRDATKAAKKQADAILRVEKERDAEEYSMGQSVLQHEVLAPMLKDKQLSSEMIQKVGRELKVHKKGGASLKSVAIALKKKIADESIKLEEMKQKEQGDAQRQEAEVEKSKNTPRDFASNAASALAQAFSGSARGEAARDLIRQGITSEQQEVMDRNNTYKERRASLGLTPEKTLTLAEQKAMKKNINAQIAGGDADAKFTISNDYVFGSGSKTTNQRIQIANALIDAKESQYAPEDVPEILQSIQNLEESGYEFNKENTSEILSDVRTRGAKNVMAELLNNEHATQKAKAPDDTGAGKLEETSDTKKDKTEETTKDIEKFVSSLLSSGSRSNPIKDNKGKVIGYTREMRDSEGKKYIVTYNKKGDPTKYNPI
jgi:hypothetical protein